MRYFLSFVIIDFPMIFPYSLPARLAVESCVHEARGLDVLPSTIAKFRNNGDEATAALLEGVVYPEEVNHCRAGVRWFRRVEEVYHCRAGVRWFRRMTIFECMTNPE